MPTFDADQIHAAPKVLLHDHLDGGLRPATVLDLASKVGHELPAQTEEELGAWFAQAANSGNLVTYLETFAHTVAVMQTTEALHRVAYECAIDLADDGVVYAEVRYAPELFVEKGLGLTEVVEAVTSGFVDGMADASEQGTKIVIRSLLCGMRQAGRVKEIAELAVAYRDQGVAGFDIAGPEDGFAPTDHQEAFDYLRGENAHFTIHAGEAAGLQSIWQALQCCHAERLGHGVRIIDEVTRGGAPVMDDLAAALANPQEIELGRLASYVRDNRIPLEMCPHSNVQTGAAPSIGEHPITLLKKLGFTVTINTDNRLMSETSMGKEFTELVAQAGWSGADLRDATVSAMEGAFAPLPQREAIIAEVIRPGYADLGVA